MQFRTQNSVYEVDLVKKRIRRMDGDFTATPRQGKDGEWKNFVHITPIVEGHGVYIVWSYDENIARGTYTSEVVAILN